MSKKVVIIGAGFGGLAAAKSLNHEEVALTLIDKSNHHLFLPLLYEVSTAMLAPSDVAMPIRGILRKQTNTQVIMSAVYKIDLESKVVLAGGRKYDYDYLVVSSGLRSSYFGKDRWEEFAPGLKTLTDAVKIREKILSSFEKAECGISPGEQNKLLTFVVVGGGPTGVEIAGGIAGMAKKLPRDFKQFGTAATKVILLETLDRILGGFSVPLSAKAKKALEDLGVDVRLNVRITDIDAGGITTDTGRIETENVVWAAGARSQPFVHSSGFETDRSGRVLVDDYCSLKRRPEVFVIGDAAGFIYNGKPLPATAPVAIQQGKYASHTIIDEIREKPRKPFVYKDKGSLAVLGKHKAVLQKGKLQISGYLAWLIWIVIHIAVIAEFQNRFIVVVRWLWFYATGHHGVRLIVSPAPPRDQL